MTQILHIQKIIFEVSRTLISCHDSLQFSKDPRSRAVYDILNGYTSVGSANKKASTDW